MGMDLGMLIPVFHLNNPHLVPEVMTAMICPDEVHLLKYCTAVASTFEHLNLRTAACNTCQSKTSHNSKLCSLFGNSTGSYMSVRADVT